jgi:phosphate transport system substrate-binding protein
MRVSAAQANDPEVSMGSSRLRALGALAVTAALSLGVTACGDSGGTGGGGGGDSKLSGTIKADGSSTVGPLTEAAAEQFQGANPNVRVTVGTSGTGGGFEKFCAGETDISDASRSIEDDEKSACQKEGINYEEIQVANDGLAVVVNNDNDFVKCLKVDQLKKIWDKGSKVQSWKDVDPSFPDEKIELYGPGTDSGTFDYFTEAINGEEGRSRTDYNASEDDNVTVQGVAGGAGGIGYFGLSYAEENSDKLKVVEIDGGGGCVAPSVETVQSGDYKPLSRPLFIYPKAASLERPEVKAFVDDYIKNATSIAEQAQFVPLTSEQQQKSDQKVQGLAGT